MRECRFHRELYPQKAVDDAMAIYARYADLAVSDQGEHRVVTVSGKSPARERKIAYELANYALGLTRGGSVG